MAAMNIPDLILSSSVSAVVGFFAGTAAKWKERRNIKHAALGSVLHTLLEVQNAVDGLILLQEFSSALLSHDPRGLHHLNSAISKMIPDLKAQIDEYEKAIKILAGEDPVLAYKIRASAHSLSMITNILKAIKEHPEAQGEPPNWLAAVEKFMHKIASDELKETAWLVAEQHGKETVNKLFELRRDIKKKDGSFVVEKVKPLLVDLSEGEQAEFQQTLEHWASSQQQAPGS